MSRNFGINFDGSCWPNPGGVAAYGCIVTVDGKEIHADHGIIDGFPVTTNNIAEFFALAKGLEYLNGIVDTTDRGGILRVFGDSSLVINMMNKDYHPKPHMPYFPAYEMAESYRKRLKNKGLHIFFSWVPRKNNAGCDELSKKHLEKPKKT